MHRIQFTTALLAIAPAVVHAQAATPKAVDAAAPEQAPARRSHSPFGEAIIQLTRAAREQAAATKAAAPGAKADARPSAPKPVSAPVSALPAGAPVLADSNRS
jgi:hypothetical protein